MSLFDTIPGPNEARFAGAAYEPERDDARLRGQILRVHGAMADGRWRTVEEIHPTDEDCSCGLTELRRRWTAARQETRQ